MVDEDCDRDSLDGRIVMHAPASERHEALFAFLLTLLNTYTAERGSAAVRGSRYPMRLDARWSSQPDIVVVRAENVSRLQKQFLNGPADLTIEIVSESDPQLDLREKLPRYRAAGVQEIWLIDPLQRNVRVEQKTATGYDVVVKTDGRLASLVVAGFWIDVEWLWREQLPRPLPCLRQILG
jgi:Uma2 family endonuclease